MAVDTPILMEKLYQTLEQMLKTFPWDLFPWAHSLSTEDRCTFLLEVMQTVQRRDARQLAELLEDWQATAESLTNTRFMQAYQQPSNATDDVPWEQVRGELDDLSHRPEAGGA
jgi:hypothetical protein